MATETNRFADVGSVNEYAKRVSRDPCDPETIREYGVELVERREQVAKSIGITTEEFRIRVPGSSSTELPG